MAERKTKTTKDVSLHDVLWACRNALRNVGSLDKNRDAVIGLVFLKFAGDKFEKQREKIRKEYGDIPAFLEKDSFYRSDNVFYLPEHARWSYIVDNASSDDIAIILDKAMKEIEDRNPPLQGALIATTPDGQKNNTFYTMLGASKASLKTLINEINKICPERFEEEDLIGKVYEYFLQSYAVAAKKEDGEFYTPPCVVKLIAEMIEPYSGVVYDPCFGSGGMFVSSLKFVERHHGNRNEVSIVGQELNPDTWRLCKMNLALRGISCDLGKSNGDTFSNDQHRDRTVDFVMANPPFNLKNWRAEDELIGDPRWSGYTIPRAANANYAWILHILSKLDVSHGVGGFLLANGALNDSDEYSNRKQLLKNDKIEAIIVLPRDMFYTTDISVTLWIVNNNKKACNINGRQLRDRTHEVLFVDLRGWNSNIESYALDKGSKKKVVLSDEQIEKVKSIYNGWQSIDRSLYRDVPELCQSVKLMNSDLTEEERENQVSTIESKDYSLAPSKYIVFIDHDLEIDYRKEMLRIQSEMKQVMADEKKSQTMMEDAFRRIGYEID